MLHSLSNLTPHWNDCARNHFGGFSRISRKNEKKTAVLPTFQATISKQVKSNLWSLSPESLSKIVVSYPSTPSVKSNCVEFSDQAFYSSRFVLLLFTEESFVEVIKDFYPLFSSLVSFVFALVALITVKRVNKEMN